MPKLIRNPPSMLAVVGWEGAVQPLPKLKSPAVP